jgi:hypothetical protein
LRGPATSAPRPSAASTNLPPCPWPHSLTKCPRNRVRFIPTCRICVNLIVKHARKQTSPDPPRRW